MSLRHRALLLCAPALLLASCMDYYANSNAIEQLRRMESVALAEASREQFTDRLAKVSDNLRIYEKGCDPAVQRQLKRALADYSKIAKNWAPSQDRTRPLEAAKYKVDWADIYLRADEPTQKAMLATLERDEADEQAHDEYLVRRAAAYRSPLTKTGEPEEIFLRKPVAGRPAGPARSAAASPAVAPLFPKPVAPAKREVIVITQPYEAALRYGSASLTPGARLDVVSRESGVVRVRYGSEVIALPAGVTRTALR